MSHRTVVFVATMFYSISMSLPKNLFSVEMLLRDMLYVSYLIDPARLTAFLPSILRPALVDGKNVFVTLVIFRGKTKAAATIPAPRIPFDQVNIRTYVIDPETEKPAVYFVQCGISGALITSLYRILSGMPVEHTPFSIKPEKLGGDTYTRYNVSGSWHGEFTIDCSEISSTLTALSPFDTVQNAINYLIDPLVGFYSHGPILRRLEVYHDPLIPRVCTPSRIVFPYLSRLGIVKEDEISRPHNILLVPFTPFLIYLPARAYVRI